MANPGQQFSAPCESFGLCHLHDGRWVIRHLDDISHLYAALDPEQPNRLGLVHIEHDQGLSIALQYTEQRLTALHTAQGHRIELHYTEFDTPSGTVHRLSQARRLPVPQPLPMAPPWRTVE